MPKVKLIESPERLMEIFEEYKAFTLANPRTKWVLSQKTAEMVAEPLRIPLTNEGFEIFCYNNYSDVHNYFDNTQGRYSAYKAVCSHIKKEIRNDQITGGMVGQFNPSITQRLNALKEHTDVTSDNEKISAITVTIVKPTE
jgi:alpha-acetolactate decarboxylase